MMTRSNTRCYHADNEINKSKIKYEIGELSPTFQGLKQEKVCSFIHCWVNLWVALASFCVSSIKLSCYLRAGRKVLPRGG